MGCVQSAPRWQAEAGQLELELIKAVQLSQHRARIYKTRTTTFSALLMHFWRMRPGFQKILALLHELSGIAHLSKRESFDNSSQGRQQRAESGFAGTSAITHVRGRVDIPKLEAGLEALHLDPTSPAVVTVVRALKAEGKDIIDGDDFLVMWTVLHLLEPTKLVVVPEIRVALETVEEAFLCFDSTHDGRLERKELMGAMHGSKHKNKKGEDDKKGKKRWRKGPAERLFAELDLDKHGSISFREFLLGIYKIVMEDVVEEEEAEAAIFLATPADEETNAAAGGAIAADIGKKSEAGSPLYDGK